MSWIMEYDSFYTLPFNIPVDKLFSMYTYINQILMLHWNLLTVNVKVTMFKDAT